LPRHSAALIATQDTAEDEHCVARHRQSIASHCITQRWLSSPKRRSGLVRLRTSMAKQSVAKQRQRTAPSSAATAQLWTAQRWHDIAPRRQIMDTQSGGRAVNLCARDWQGKAGNRYGIARPCTTVLRLRGAMRGVAWHGNAPETSGNRRIRGANAKND
jgi:hypothetical protein